MPWKEAPLMKRGVSSSVSLPSFSLGSSTQLLWTVPLRTSWGVLNWRHERFWVSACEMQRNAKFSICTEFLKPSPIDNQANLEFNQSIESQHRIEIHDVTANRSRANRSSDDDDVGGSVGEADVGHKSLLSFK